MPEFKRQPSLPIRGRVQFRAQTDPAIGMLGSIINKSLGAVGTAIRGQTAEIQQGERLASAEHQVTMAEKQLTFTDLTNQIAVKRGEEATLRREVREAEEQFDKLEGYEKTRLDSAFLSGQPLPEDVVSEENQRYKRMLAGKGAAREAVFGSGDKSFGAFTQDQEFPSFMEAATAYINTYGGDDEVFRMGMFSGMMNDFAQMGSKVFVERRQEYGRQVQLGSKSQIRKVTDGYLKGDMDFSELQGGLKSVRSALRTEAEAGAIDLSVAEIDSKIVAEAASMFGEHVTERMSQRMKAAVNSGNALEVTRTIDVLDNQIEDLERVFRMKRFGAVGGEMVPEAARSLRSLEGMRNDLARAGFEQTITNAKTVSGLLTTSEKLIQAAGVDDFGRIMNLRKQQYDNLVRGKQAVEREFVNNAMSTATSLREMVSLYREINGPEAISDLPESAQGMVTSEMKQEPILQKTVPTIDGGETALFGTGQFTDVNRTLLTNIQKLAGIDEAISNVENVVYPPADKPEGVDVEELRIRAGTRPLDPDAVLISFDNELSRRTNLSLVSLEEMFKGMDSLPQEQAQLARTREHAKAYANVLTDHLDAIGVRQVPAALYAPLDIQPGATAGQWMMFLTTAKTLRSSPRASAILNDNLGDFAQAALWVAAARNERETDQFVVGTLGQLSESSMGMLLSQLSSVDKEGQETGQLARMGAGITGNMEQVWKGRWLLARVKSESALMSGSITPEQAYDSAVNTANQAVETSFPMTEINGNSVRMPSEIYSRDGKRRTLAEIGVENLGELFGRYVEVGLEEMKQSLASRAVSEDREISGAELASFNASKRETIPVFSQAYMDGDHMVVPVQLFRPGIGTGVSGFMRGLITPAEKERPLHMDAFEIRVLIPSGDDDTREQLRSDAEKALTGRESQIGVAPQDMTLRESSMRQDVLGKLAGKSKPPRTPTNNELVTAWKMEFTRGGWRGAQEHFEAVQAGTIAQPTVDELRRRFDEHGNVFDE